MKLNKKLIAVLLCTVILLSLSMAVYAAHPFKDVGEDTWCNEAVDFVYNNGLMSGINDETFAPNRTMTRGMLVTVLYRLEGSPAVTVENPFADVREGAYYHEAIRWAFENKIVEGTSSTTFSPDSNLTRQQMVTVFYRYARNYKALDVSELADLNGYHDADTVSAYAWDAFRWAVEAGIISGTSDTTLTPHGSATRAQCAVILQRFIIWTENNAEHPTNPPSVTPNVTPTIMPTTPTTLNPSIYPTATPNISPTTAPTATPTPIPEFSPIPSPTITQPPSPGYNEDQLPAV